jgi:uncharacterized repeat protein (TIGR01451 family)
VKKRRRVSVGITTALTLGALGGLATTAASHESSGTVSCEKATFQWSDFHFKSGQQPNTAKMFVEVNGTTAFEGTSPPFETDGNATVPLHNLPLPTGEITIATYSEWNTNGNVEPRHLVAKVTKVCSSPPPPPIPTVPVTPTPVTPAPTPTPTPTPRKLKSGFTVKKTGPAQLRNGNTGRYRIAIRNTGNTTLRNLTVRDRLPEGLNPGKLPKGARVVNGDIVMKVKIIPPGITRIRIISVRAVTDRRVRTCNFVVVRTSGGLTKRARACTTLVPPPPKRIIPPVAG